MAFLKNGGRQGGKNDERYLVDLLADTVGNKDRLHTVMSHLKDFEWRAGPDHLEGDHTQR